MSNNETVQPFTTFQAHRDDYGRSCHSLVAFPAYRTLGVVVRLPECAWANHDGNKYLVNDWSNECAVTYHPTLKVAKGYLSGVVTLPEVKA